MTSSTTGAHRTLIAPSLLASDWTRLSEEVRAVLAGGADWLHLDVMDGHFVPPITFGPQLVKAAKSSANFFADVHLMIERPEVQVAEFVEAGADLITVHVEACPHLHRVLQLIRSHGRMAGVALNPGTPVALLSEVLPLIDLVLVMSVNPGWGGQAFIEGSVTKIQQLSRLRAEHGAAFKIEVDGGIVPETAALCRTAGADVLVAGTAVFKSRDYRLAIEALRG